MAELQLDKNYVRDIIERAIYAGNKSQPLEDKQVNEPNPTWSPNNLRKLILSPEGVVVQWYTTVDTNLNTLETFFTFKDVESTAYALSMGVQNYLGLLSKNHKFSNVEEIILIPQSSNPIYSDLELDTGSLVNSIDLSSHPRLASISIAVEPLSLKEWAKSVQAAIQNKTHLISNQLAPTQFDTRDLEVKPRYFTKMALRPFYYKTDSTGLKEVLNKIYTYHEEQIDKVDKENKEQGKIIYTNEMKGINEEIIQGFRSGLQALIAAKQLETKVMEKEQPPQWVEVVELSQIALVQELQGYTIYLEKEDKEVLGQTLINFLTRLDIITQTPQLNTEILAQVIQLCMLIVDNWETKVSAYGGLEKIIKVSSEMEELELQEIGKELALIVKAKQESSRVGVVKPLLHVYKGLLQLLGKEEILNKWATLIIEKEEEKEVQTDLSQQIEVDLDSSSTLEMEQINLSSETPLEPYIEPHIEPQLDTKVSLTNLFQPFQDDEESTYIDTIVFEPHQNNEIEVDKSIYQSFQDNHNKEHEQLGVSNEKSYNEVEKQILMKLDLSKEENIKKLKPIWQQLNIDKGWFINLYQKLEQPNPEFMREVYYFVTQVYSTYKYAWSFEIRYLQLLRFVDTQYANLSPTIEYDTSLFMTNTEGKTTNREQILKALDKIFYKI